MSSVSSERPVPSLPELRSARDRHDALAAAAQDRAARSRRGLAELLTMRPELLGVHAPADLAYESIRWSA